MHQKNTKNNKNILDNVFCSLIIVALSHSECKQFQQYLHLPAVPMFLRPMQHSHSAQAQLASFRWQFHHSMHPLADRLLPNGSVSKFLGLCRSSQLKWIGKIQIKWNQLASQIFPCYLWLVALSATNFSNTNQYSHFHSGSMWQALVHCHHLRYKRCIQFHHEYLKFLTCFVKNWGSRFYAFVRLQHQCATFGITN